MSTGCTRLTPNAEPLTRPSSASLLFSKSEHVQRAGYGRPKSGTRQRAVKPFAPVVRVCGSGPPTKLGWGQDEVRFTVVSSAAGMKRISRVPLMAMVKENGISVPAAIDSMPLAGA